MDQGSICDATPNIVKHIVRLVVLITLPFLALQVLALLATCNTSNNRRITEGIKMSLINGIWNLVQTGMELLSNSSIVNENWYNKCESTGERD